MSFYREVDRERPNKCHSIAEVDREKSETELTASVLKKSNNKKKIQKI